MNCESGCGQLGTGVDLEPATEDDVEARNDDDDDNDGAVGTANDVNDEAMYGVMEQDYVIDWRDLDRRDVRIVLCAISNDSLFVFLVFARKVLGQGSFGVQFLCVIISSLIFFLC